MSVRQRRPRLEIAKAVHRLTTEPLITLIEAGTTAGVSPDTVRRWIIDGVRGTHLDGLHRPGQGWLTSRAAVDRFKAARSCGEN